MAEKDTRRGAMPAAPSSGSYHPLMGLRDEVDRLFDNFLPSVFGKTLFEPDQLWGQRPFRVFGDLTPDMDVRECADHYEVSAELPGIAEKDVAVRLQGDVLTISGEKRQEREEGEGDAVRLSERTYGSFSRAMRLPANADESGIAASYAKGVLTVTIPKKAGGGAAGKTIEIKTH